MVLIPLLISSAFAAVPPRTEAMLVRLESMRVDPVELAPFVTDTSSDVRARAATALGRLRNPTTLGTLDTLSKDPNEAVRHAAAQALGQTSGSRYIVQRQLAVEPSHEVRTTLLNALGLQGNAWDIDTLLEFAQQTVDEGHSAEEVAAAAEALGQMAVRGNRTVEIERVCRVLLDLLRRTSNEVRASAAFSLARIRPANLNEKDSKALIHTAHDEAIASIKAHLIRASGALRHAYGDRDELLADAMTHTAPSVRIAVARTAPSIGWNGVTTLVHDPNPGVAIAAIEAVGRMPSIDRLVLLGPIVRAGALIEQKPNAAVDPKLAKAVAALSALDVPAIWWENDTARYNRVQNGLLPSLTQYMSEERSPLIRRAATAIATDPANLLRLANNDPDTGVRTAAANRLLGGRGSFTRAMRLLNSNDEMVRCTATDWLQDNPNPKSDAALLNLMATAKSPTLVQSATLALARHFGALKPRKRRSVGATNLLPGLLGHDDAGVRNAAVELAKVLKVWPNFIEYSPPPIDIAAISEVRSAVISTKYGDAIIELYPEHAPLTVRNFARLADAGFYDNLTFHRVIPDFVVQGGDPRGDGLGGPDYTIPDEINELPYKEGTIGMALSGPDTGGSQWFVTLSPQPHLDGRYTVFGRVTQGLHVFRSIHAGDQIDNISIERIMGPSDVHEMEMEMATQRLAALKNEAAVPDRRKKVQPSVQSANAIDEEPKPKKSKKKAGKSDNNPPSPPLEVPTEDAIDPDQETIDDLPEEHEKEPEEDPINEGEKIDVDLLDEDARSDK